MTTTHTPRISGPADLVRTIPSLLGFRPDRDVVLVVLDKQGLLLVSARLDDDETLPTISATLDAIVTAGGHTAVVVHYLDVSDDALSDTDPAFADSGRLLSKYREQIERAGLTFKEGISTNGSRYWQPLCPMACCPVEGMPVADKPTEVETLAVAHGTSPFASRDEMVDAVQPDTERIDDDAAVKDFAAIGTKTGAWIVEFGRSGGTLSDRNLGVIGCSLWQVHIRDAVWLAMEADAELDLRNFLTVLVRRLPDRLAVQPLFLLAWLTWRKGDGATSRACLDRLLDLDADHGGGRSLMAALGSGVNPQRIPRLTAV